MTLELRPIDTTDDDFLQALQQQDDVWEFIGALPLAAYEAGNHVFAIVDGPTQLGFAGLFKSKAAGRDDFELLCATRSEAQQHGIATQACQLVLDWGIGTAKLPRVIACIDEANHPARAIATRIGMREQGRLAGDRLLYVKDGASDAKSRKPKPKR